MSNTRFEPWFGAWPPEVRRGYFAMDGSSTNWWQRWALRLLAFSVFLAGIAFILAAHIWEHYQLLADVVRDIGIALLVAVLIGTTIEWFTRSRLLEDTLKIALGYILPDELKSEVRALYEIPFVVTEHNQQCTLKATNNPDCVVLHIKGERTFKNITSSKRPLALGVTITESFHPTIPSRIIDMGCTYAGEQWGQFTVEKSPKEGHPVNKLQAKLDHPIVLSPGDSCTLYYETEEVKRATDTHMMVFEYPTVKPRVVFHRAAGFPSPSDVAVTIAFGTRHREKVESLGRDTKRLNGTLTPYQHIELRWWKTEDFDGWVQDAKKA